MQWLRQATPRLEPRTLRTLHRVTFLRLSSSTSSSTDSNNNSVSLRPYQQSCLDACLDTLTSGVSRIGVSLPTGAGKTVVFISLLSLLRPPELNTSATRALIIVNSVELARQAKAKAEEMFPEWMVEIEQGQKERASGMADVTVATYQTLLQSERLAKFDARSLKAIIVDEAHHAAAPSYRRILSQFSPEIRHPDLDGQDASEVTARPAIEHTHTHTIPIIGFSATFSRHDGLALGSVFEKIVYHRDFLEMIKEQWLCDVRFTSVRANINLKDVTLNHKSGDFNPTSLAHVINTPTVNHLVVKAWLDRASTRKSTLVFCVNLAHVRDLTRAFREFGVDARYVYAGTPMAERRALIAGFKDGQFPVLVNCAILTEGADIPNIDCVVVARPTRSRNVFAQMIGRGMRLSPSTGKEDCHIIDFVESTARVSGIVSTPTLFGLDPGEVNIEDDTLETLESKAASARQAADSFLEPSYKPSLNIPDPKSVTYIDYDNPFSLADSASGAPHINQLSQYAWVGCGKRSTSQGEVEEVYVLECLRKGFMKIERVAGPAEEQGVSDLLYLEEITSEGSDDAQRPQPQLEGAEVQKEDASLVDHHYRATYTPAMPDKVTLAAFKMSPYMRARQVLIAKNLSDAVRGCDTYVKNKVVRGPTLVGLLRTAKWRRAPATDSQTAFVEKRLIRSGGNTMTRDELDNMTRGEAANIITRLKHGAQMRYEKRVKEENKLKKASLKEHMRMARERIGVGPLPT